MGKKYSNNKKQKQQENHKIWTSTAEQDLFPSGWTVNNNSATGNSYPTAMTSLYLSVIGGSSNISQHFFMKNFCCGKICCNDPAVPSWIRGVSVTLPLSLPDWTDGLNGCWLLIGTLPVRFSGLMSYLLTKLTAYTSILPFLASPPSHFIISNW